MITCAPGGDARADIARGHWRGHAGVPQDTQAEAFDYPAPLFDERVWQIQRPRGDADALARAAAAIRDSRRPMIIAGGGVLYSEATDALARFAVATGIPVAETQAGKSAIAWDHPLALGSIGVTGKPPPIRRPAKPTS